MSHRWRFVRAGGFDQVRIDSGEDIAALGELDPKLWVALSCPAKGLELDERTLALLDADGDGRIRVPEVVAAARWACSLLKSPDDLIKGAATLPLAAIDQSKEEGRLVASSALEVLRSLGKEGASEISAADTADRVKIFSKTIFNGDGIVPAEAAGSDAATAQAIRDVMACLGAEKDLSGLDGISKARLDQFYTEAGNYLEWWKKGSSDAKANPLDARTSPAVAAWSAVRVQVDDYFARCALAAMDERAGPALAPREADYLALANKPLSAASKELALMPLAAIGADRPLPLLSGLNPAWAAAIAKLEADCVEPILGDKNTLSAEDWAQIGARLAGHEAWLGQRPAQSVEKLGVTRLEELVAGGAKAAIEALIAKDNELAPQAKALASVDKLVHFYRDLHVFLRNFVSFGDFYGRRAKATFQVGTLLLDGRSCDLCLRVDDVAKHSALASHSASYLAYCECTRKGGGEKMTIVAAFTGGDADFLMAGRNGIFYDRKGGDWDATITKVVDQPISVRQAFWAPYKRVGKFVSDQIEKFASAKDKSASDALAEHVVTAPGAAPPPPPSPAAAAAAAEAAKPAPFDVARFAGIFAALGLAMGALGTAFAAIIGGFFALAWWQMPLALGGAVLAFSGPSMLFAANRLRQRNLGPLLDAGGWAINSRARINIPFGGSLTQLATPPPGSERSLSDPYADKKRPWGVYVFLLIALAGLGYWLHASGHIQHWLDLVLGPK